MNKYKCVCCGEENKFNHNVGLTRNNFNKKSHEEQQEILCIKCLNKGKEF